MKNKVLEIVKGTIICAVCTAMFVPNVMAGSTTVNLYSNQNKACSSQLGNTTGKYSISDHTYDNSDYSVETYMYYGQTSDHCGKIKAHWIVAPDKKVTKTYTISKKSGTVARITLYSNLKSNQKKDCRAKATLANK